MALGKHTAFLLQFNAFFRSLTENLFSIVFVCCKLYVNLFYLSTRNVIQIMNLKVERFLCSASVCLCVCTIHRYDYYCLHYFMRTHLALSIENERCAQPHIYLGCFPLPPISSVVVVVWLAVYCLHFSDFSCIIHFR